MWSTKKRVRVPPITPTEALTVETPTLPVKQWPMRTTGCKSQRLHERSCSSSAGEPGAAPIRNAAVDQRQSQRSEGPCSASSSLAGGTMVILYLPP